MGQIDHARNRLRELVAAKTGECPQRPKLVTPADVVKELKDGELTVKPALLKRAFDAWIAGEALEVAVVESGNYRNNYQDINELQTKIPSSLEEALCSLIYTEENAKRSNAYRDSKKAYEERCQRITKESKAVEDAIVLGDQLAALQALQEFAAMEF
jgi:hypothetical protein